MPNICDPGFESRENFRRMLRAWRSLHGSKRKRGNERRTFAFDDSHGSVRRPSSRRCYLWSVS